MARRKKLDPELERRLNELKSIVQPSNLGSYREAAEMLSDAEEFELMKVFFNEHSGVTREVWFYMVPFFQQHPDLWSRLREEVPFHIHSSVDQWLPRQILEFSGTEEEFCAFATETVREIYPGFPELKMDILTEERTGYYYSCDSGVFMFGDKGWQLRVEGMLFGPAETRERITREAVAIHPDGDLKITDFYESSPAHHVWLERVSSGE